MKTDGGQERDRHISRRAFIAAVGVHAGAAMAGVGTAADGTGGASGSVRVAATGPYRPELERAVTSYKRTRTGHNIRVVATESGVSDRLGDDIDILISGRPTFSTNGASAEIDQFVAVTDWAILNVSDGRWQECLSQGEIRNYWDGDAPVEVWSESDWESISAVARTSRSANAKHGDATTNSVPLVIGTRAYQYAHGHGGLGHYRVKDSMLDRTAEARNYSDRALPLVQLGYIHVDQTKINSAHRSFLEAYDCRKGDVSYFSSTGPAGTVMGQ